MQSAFDRRDFTRLAAAAFGGIAVGAPTLAVAQPPAPVDPPPGSGDELPDATGPSPQPDSSNGDDKKPAGGEKAKDKKGDKKEDEKPQEIHLCRGLNSCKDKGASGENKCAGQGTCATTLFAPHECATGNACRGQGGCGKFAGRNQCAGYGDGAVPLTEEDWPRLRREFEARMKRLNIPFGPPPLSRLEMESDRRKAEADAKWLAELEAKKAEAAKNRQRGGQPKAGDKNADKQDGKGALDELTRDRDRPPPAEAKPPK